MRNVRFDFMGFVASFYCRCVRRGRGAPVLAAIVVLSCAVCVQGEPEDQPGDSDRAAEAARPEAAAGESPDRGPRKRPLSDFFLDSATVEAPTTESARTESESPRSAVAPSTDSLESRVELEKPALTPAEIGAPRAEPTPPLYIVPAPKTAPAEPIPTAAPRGDSSSARSARKTKATPAPPPLDLNAATVDQLAALPGLDAERARLIVSHRTAISGFASKTQLRDVFGITDAVYNRIAPLVTVNPASVSQVKSEWVFPSASPALNASPAAFDSLPSPRTSDSILALPTLPAAAETPTAPHPPSSPAPAASPRFESRAAPATAGSAP